ncbi:hypothetical protein [Brevibacillus sp. NRS-1366]|uniref:hypothetical protein n=1 Tax=Brevibacillus sp. NRS-1366 TaxID=3233899 RepID=UPI003D1BC61B
MKKNLFMVCALLVALLTGCSSQSDTDDSKETLNSDKEYQVIVEETKSDFVYRLATQASEYSKGKPVKIYAELEYIGDDDSITISHAASPFWFPIIEKTRNFNIDYVMNQPLKKTTLIRGKPIQEEYKGSGAYSDQDPPEYVDFIKNIMLKKEFPIGDYVVNGFVSFDVEPKANNDTEESVSIKAQVEFIVR